MNKNQSVPAALISILFIFLTASSCYGPRKVNKWVDSRYGQVLNPQTRSKDDFLSISSPLVTNAQFASTTVKETKNVLPLIFYWQLDYVNTCTLNPKIPFNTFSSTFRSYANVKGMKQKLNGAKIELSVDTIPNVFAIDDEGHVVWVIYAFGWDIFSIIPEKKDMVVSYRITRDNVESKKGTVTITDTNKEIKDLRSPKNGTWDYLAKYDENIKSMAKKAADEIMNELESLAVQSVQVK